MHTGICLKVLWQKTSFSYRKSNTSEIKFIITVVHHIHSQKHSHCIKESFMVQSFMDKLWSSYRIKMVRITEQCRLDRTSVILQSNIPVKTETVSNLHLPDQRTHPGTLWKSPSTETQQLLCLTTVIVTFPSIRFRTAASDLVLASPPSSTQLWQKLFILVHWRCSYNLCRTLVKRLKSTTTKQVTHNTTSTGWATESQVATLQCSWWNRQHRADSNTTLEIINHSL